MTLYSDLTLNLLYFQDSFSTCEQNTLVENKSTFQCVPLTL